MFIHKCNCYGAEKKVIIGFHNTPGPAEHAMIRGAGGKIENAWSVSHIGSQVPHDGGITGAGIKIAVLDTGIDWAVANQMDIINLSMGFATRYQSLADAREAAHAAGLVVVAAAGNSYGGPVCTRRLSRPS
ncbi:MAG: hypothetical protein KZQ97_20020 [Candidatus Thiodiazotropha sp. (ex Dulcina madagascariensis)]|nr:hypothetical protein [Candidatus Thiodiazotropha sp. (ex Dulcina madagascariensis)]